MKIAEIKDFLSKTELPKTIILDGGSTIIDVSKFFDSHLFILESEANKKTKMIHYERIMKAIESIKLDKSENESVGKGNDLDFSAIANIQITSTMKPNVEFEKSVEPKFEPKINQKSNRWLSQKLSRKLSQKFQKKK